MEISRFKWGCGDKPPLGWMNSDRLEGDGVDVVCDIRDGIPLLADTFDYIASIHALQDLPYLDVIPALRESSTTASARACSWRR